MDSLIQLIKRHGLNVAVLLLIFTASIVFRAPYMDRPLSHNFEWLTAHTLIVQQIWFEEGALKNKFAQKMNFNNDADKFINNASMSNHYNDYPIGFDDSYFYLSNPSFGLIPPYLLFKAFNIYPTPKAIQFFNLGLQLLCSLLLYLVIERKTHIASQAFNFPAIVAGAVYILLPTTLWFHSNVYYIEIFVQLPFILTVFFATLYFDETDTSRKNVYLYLLSISLFFTATTEWIGALLGATLCLYTLLNLRKGLDTRLFIFTCLATAGGLAAFIAHNSMVVGFTDFINHEIRQFFFQTNTAGNLTPEKQAKLSAILSHYFIGTFPVLALILATIIGAIAAISWSDCKSRFGTIIFLFLLPCLVHHTLLSRFTTEHWYAILKSTFFLASLLALLVYYNQFLFKNKFVFYLTFILVALTLTQKSHHSYLYHAITGGNPQHYQILGNFISSQAKDDEVIFLINHDAWPQLLYYARRNLQPVSTIEEAQNWLDTKGTKAEKAIVFNLEKRTFTRISTTK